MPCITSSVTSSTALYRTETYVLGDQQKDIFFTPFLSQMPSCLVGVYEFSFNGVKSISPAYISFSTQGFYIRILSNTDTSFAI